MVDREKYVRTAQLMYGGEDIDIPDSAEIKTDDANPGGVWVAAFVFVPDEEVEDLPPEDDEDEEEEEDA